MSAAAGADPRLAAPEPWPFAPEAALRRRVWFGVAAIGLLGVWYFAWLLQPERIGHPALFGLLLAAELFNALQLAGFAWTISRQRLRPALRHPDPDGIVVDVLVPTFDEPVEIVEPTVAAAVRLRGARIRVALLDDGDRAEMAAVAKKHGAGYVTRTDRAGAKAGNLNHALRRTTGTFVLVLDCDHVPSEDLLEATLGHLAADERLAFVQTPQYYANARASAVGAAAWAQQALFFGAIAPGKDGHGATFCCGTNVVFRRSALEQSGGFPEASLTEDFQLSIRLHEQGWRSAYVPLILARGLGPEDMAAYVSQQQRWARGCVSALPAVCRARLPWRLRLQYLLSASYFLTGWTLAVYMALPVVRILTGEQPLAATTANAFVLHFAPWFAAALAAVALAAGGKYTFGAFALAAASFWIHVQATVRAILRLPGRFVVTPKQGAMGRQPRAVAPALAALAVLAGVSVYGLLLDRSAATLNNVAFAGLHIAVLLFGVLPALQRRPRPRPEPQREPDSQPATAAAHGVRVSRLAWVVVAGALAVPASAALLGRSALEPVPTLGESARAAAETFVARYAQPDGRVVRSDQAGDTVSEGQAYGLLIAVALNDEPRFAAIWRWARTHLLRRDGLLAYRWLDGRVVGRQPASDADLDAAWALLLASERFDEPAYREQGLRLAEAVLTHETAAAGRRIVLVAGPWARSDPRVVNASYFSPRAYSVLGAFAEDERWRALTVSSRHLLARLTQHPTRLPPDWAAVPAAGGEPEPRPQPGGSEPRYGLDAARVLVRLAASCEAADRRRAAAAWPFLRRAARDGIASAYALDGTPRDHVAHATALVAAAAAADAAGARGARDRLLRRAQELDARQPTYYGAAWVALGRILLTTRALGVCDGRGQG